MTPVKPLITTFIFTLFILSSIAQNRAAGYLLAFTDSTSGKELWGFRTSSGEVIIKPQYDASITDTLFEIAFVIVDSKWSAIDRQGKIILTPYIFDNGPDYIQEGLFRFVEENKIGFANKNGEKIILPTFEFASTFNSGLAAFNIGGQLKKTDEEHSSRQGGLWGFIDKKGRIAIEPKFTKVYDFEGKYCEVWTQDGKHILIDKKGNTFKVFTK